MRAFSPKRIHEILNRNQYGLKGVPSKRNAVNIEGEPLLNVGDSLGPAIVSWMLEGRGLDPAARVEKTGHLMTVGSIVSFGLFDAVIWGSGIRDPKAPRIIRQKKKYLHRRFDIRAVRGPLTRKALLDSGYSCPAVYGDPAILMPLIYPAENHGKGQEIGVILHYKTAIAQASGGNGAERLLPVPDALTHPYHLRFIDPRTTDYKTFIDAICRSKLVISSSLHGIILAEAYGIPAIFLNFGVDEQQTKYEDWYLSTNRKTAFCTSLDDALRANAPPLPELSAMRRELMACFPYDLWEE